MGSAQELESRGRMRLPHTPEDNARASWLRMLDQAQQYSFSPLSNQRHARMALREEAERLWRLDENVIAPIAAALQVLQREHPRVARKVVQAFASVAPLEEVAGRFGISINHRRPSSRSHPTTAA